MGLNVEPRQAAETLLPVPSHTAQPCPGTRDCTHGSLEHLSLDRNWRLLRACSIYQYSKDRENGLTGDSRGARLPETHIVEELSPTPHSFYFQLSQN